MYYERSKVKEFIMIAYKRVLLKLSGEALMGNLGYGIDPAVVAEIAQEVARAPSRGMINADSNNTLLSI